MILNYILAGILFLGSGYLLRLYIVNIKNLFASFEDFGSSVFLFLIFFLPFLMGVACIFRKLDFSIENDGLLIYKITGEILIPWEDITSIRSIPYSFTIDGTSGYLVLANISNPVFRIVGLFHGTWGKPSFVVGEDLIGYKSAVLAIKKKIGLV